MTAQQVRALALDQCARYPGLEPQDLVKALYQAVLGCGHMVKDEAQALAGLKKEAACVEAKPGEAVEPLGAAYCRVHLAPYAQSVASLATLARLFALSAQDGVQSEELAGALEHLVALAEALPVDAARLRAYVADYLAAGCPAVHHSEAFRVRYAPAYRVVAARYAACLPLFRQIDDCLREQQRAIVAIDGMSGSGKSTLAALLAQVYDAPVVHMDDFFLQPHQRTPERYRTPGGNVDHERFAQEVLAPLLRGEAFTYRPFDCHRMAFGAPVSVSPGRVFIIEGSYSLHPALEQAMDVRVFLRVDPALQRARIRLRNGEAMLERFETTWIPLENRYIEATHLDARCGLRGDVAAYGRIEWEERP